MTPHTVCTSDSAWCGNFVSSALISELYEGLKIVQRGRLEDQRGTEINFEMPDFLRRNQVPKTLFYGKLSHEDFQDSYTLEYTIRRLIILLKLL